MKVLKLGFEEEAMEMSKKFNGPRSVMSNLLLRGTSGAFAGKLGAAKFHGKWKLASLSAASATSRELWGAVDLELRVEALEKGHQGP